MGIRYEGEVRVMGVEKGAGVGRKEEGRSRVWCREGGKGVR